ncbi:hypothetical protein N7462_004795 [Penicillium macrosclerotiorum]|uniref:uncharacterized protein n=1 Tax=Penicillium macrosclerotiorum TaxID=303699 RepID=UPI0025490889|nr:uncharacterized protein N7462_004795 [Penicillium macrosclerotiorum]KAJ5690403.1 hypothetical protein N7462_004795 [Penicillium macrosclerotiorum]
MADKSDNSQKSPVTPIYILRGHVAPIHALNILSGNLRLISGDADGWVVIWDLVTKRPVAVWKAHEGAVLEVKGLYNDTGSIELYTHGRDHKLCVWKLRTEDESFLDKTLPVDISGSVNLDQGTKPWLLHSLPVNALNFCAFSMTIVSVAENPDQTDICQPSVEKRRNVLFAVPNAIDSGGIDIFHLPSERRLTTIQSDPSTKTGMLMAVNLFLQHGNLYVASAFEDGHVVLFMQKGPFTLTSFESGNITSQSWKWVKVYSSSPHSQPVLSIDTVPTLDYFISSSADSLITKHPVPVLNSAGYTQPANYAENTPVKTINTKHSGQQGLRIRSDGKIFATAGWDSRVRVYSSKTMKELAVLKWHKEGCYAVAFGQVLPGTRSEPSSTQSEKSESWRSTPGTDRHSAEKSLAAVHLQRNKKIQQTHWLAAGSKDGKVSLWDIY